MNDRIIFQDAFNPFLVRQNVYTLAITFTMDMAVSVLGAIPLFNAGWILVASAVFFFYLGVNLVQVVLAFPLIWRDSDGAVRIGDWPLAFIITATLMCVWPLQSIAVWVMNVIVPAQ